MVRAIKGTKDILPLEMPHWYAMEEAARRTFTRFGYEEIRTPIFEETELFARGIGEATDVVSKEMYTFPDRSGNSLTLRPEMTACVVRAYLENHLDRYKNPLRLFYMGPMFRYERPQKGRFRQFHQVGAEVIGTDHPAVEAEAIEMLLLMLERLGVCDCELVVNSIGCRSCRPAYLETLRQAVTARLDRFCPDCQDRSTRNVLRILDCKREECQPEIAALPEISNHLCPPCRSHFENFLLQLQAKQISYRHVPRLVRGLDYYERTTFEITHGRLGAQNALAGGGRYDGLSEMLGGKAFHGFGFAMGLERLSLALPEKAVDPYRHVPDVCILPLGDQAWPPASRILSRLRRLDLYCHMDYEDRSLKAGLRNADRLGAGWALILGDEELQSGKWQLKNLREQSQQTLSEDELYRLLPEWCRQKKEPSVSPTISTQPLDIRED